MSDHYCSSSMLVAIPADKLEAAKVIMERVLAEIEQEHVYCDNCGAEDVTPEVVVIDVPDCPYGEEKICPECGASLQEENGTLEITCSIGPDGARIHEDEYFNPHQAEAVVKALVEELDLQGTFLCAWAYTASGPISGAFGGGAFAVKKGQATVWIDAANMALELANDRLAEPGTKLFYEQVKRLFNDIVTPVLVESAIDCSLPGDMNACHWGWFEEKAEEYGKPWDEVGFCEETECAFVEAEEGEDFQKYVFKNGGNVPPGTFVGVEIRNPRTGEWELHLYNDILFA